MRFRIFFFYISGWTEGSAHRKIHRRVQSRAAIEKDMEPGAGRRNQRLINPEENPPGRGVDRMAGEEFEKVWEKIQAHEGEKFYTKTGL
jgi:hypothetical protein